MSNNISHTNLLKEIEERVFKLLLQEKAGSQTKIQITRIITLLSRVINANQFKASLKTFNSIIAKASVVSEDLNSNNKDKASAAVVSLLEFLMDFEGIYKILSLNQSLINKKKEEWMERAKEEKGLDETDNIREPAISEILEDRDFKALGTSIQQSMRKTVVQPLYLRTKELIPGHQSIIGPSLGYIISDVGNLTTPLYQDLLKALAAPTGLIINVKKLALSSNPENLISDITGI